MTKEIHADALIHPSVRMMGDGISIREGVKIYRGGEILGPDVVIGAETFINRDAYIRPQVTIGERVNLGPFVRLITDTHEIGSRERRAGAHRFDAITIGDGVWIGANATVLPGVSIGAGSVVAAGAIVTQDVPEDVLVGGVPARVIKHLSAPGANRQGGRGRLHASSGGMIRKLLSRARDMPSRMPRHRLLHPFFVIFRSTKARRSTSLTNVAAVPRAK